MALKSLSEANTKDRVIIVDNTNFPPEGALPKDNIILEYASTSHYKMSYNLRNVSIFMGVISMVMLFTIGSLCYLTKKL